VPFTFVLFWLRYLPRHDWSGTSLHVALLVVVIVCAIRFQHLAKITLRGQQREPIRFREKWKEIAIYKEAVKRTWRIMAATVTTFILLVIVSDGAIEGYRTRGAVMDDVRDISFDHRIVIPVLLRLIGANAFANFEEADVSTKPSDWFLVEDNELPRIVSGAQLKNRNLRYASARGAFLVKADLRGADLQEADLSGAQLQEADLFLAKLQGAKLQFAQLQKANLCEANLQGADLNEAQLQEANLFRANLENAKNLNQEQINQSCIDPFTRLPHGFMRPMPCRVKSRD